jgi:hypothetical protein
MMLKFSIQGMTNNVKLTFSYDDTYTGGLQIGLSERNRIGDTKYNI